MKVMDFNLNLSVLQLSLSLEWPCCRKRRGAPMPVQVPVPVPVRVPVPVSSDPSSGSTCASALPQTVCQRCREVEVVYITVKGKGSRYHSVRGCSHAMVALTPGEARARGFSRCTQCFSPRVPKWVRTPHVTHASRNDQLLKSAGIFSPLPRVYGQAHTVCRRHMEAYSTA